MIVSRSKIVALVLAAPTVHMSELVSCDSLIGTIQEMRFVIFILALGGTVSALDGGSSVWFYSGKSIHNRVRRWCL